MVGDPARSAKTLVVTEGSCLAKRLVFVLSYFIRCSLVFKQDLLVSSRPELREPLLTYRLEERQRAGMETEVPIPQSSPLCQSHSSPTMGRGHGLAPLDMRRTRSFMAGEGDLIRNPRELRDQDLERAERVNFLIGDNETLDIKEVEEEELSDEGSPGGVRMKDDLVTKAVMGEVLVDEVKEAELEGVMVTELPLLMPEVVSSKPAPLPSLMCCTSEYIPGTVLQVIWTTNKKEICKRRMSIIVLQGCYQAGDKSEAWRAPLQVLLDLETNHADNIGQHEIEHQSLFHLHPICNG